MRRRLLRPAVLLPAFAILSLGAGIAYAAWTQFDAGRIDANEALLDSVPAYPGSREIERITRTATGDGLPVPDEVLTSALYAPPPDASQADVVDFFVGSLTPEWESSTRTVTASGEDVDPDAALPSSFRVLLLTRRRLPPAPHLRHGAGPHRRARPSPSPWRAGRARARSTDLPQAQAPAADERSRLPKPLRRRLIPADGGPRRTLASRRSPPAATADLEEAAARASLDVDAVKSIEESRTYVFPSTADAIATAVVYASSLGITEREARELAGLPVESVVERWSLHRWAIVLSFTVAFAALLIFVLRPQFFPESPPAATAGARQQSRPHPPSRSPSRGRSRWTSTTAPGAGNAASGMANELAGLAYRIGTVKNADRRTYSQTRVYYPPGGEAIAERLAQELGVGTTALPGGDDPLRLVVIVGRRG